MPCFMIHKGLRLITILISQKMAPCYMVLYGKQPKIYRTWYECSQQVLGFKNARYLKYKNYEEALRDFKASLGAATLLPSQLLPDDCCEGIPIAIGKSGCWKNVLILALSVLLFALWMKINKCPSCNCNV